SKTFSEVSKSFDLLKMSVFGSKPEFNLQKNTVLVSKTNQFVVEDLMARGGYGCVVKCRKVETEEMVAVKLVKRSQYDSGVNEMKIFKTLRQFKGGNTNIVKFLEHFEHNNHFCLAFEMLDINLYEYIRCRYFFPLDINEIRVLAQQLLVALKVLKELRVTHRDIKCDNIMLVDRASQPLRVKLIDFGLSTRTYSMRNYVFKQPLSYRSPDVILDFPLDEAIDMWGLGCVLAFLYLGRHLFPSRAEYETLSVMLKLLGKPHDTLLTFGLSTERFFKQSVIWIFIGRKTDSGRAAPQRLSRNQKPLKSSGEKSNGSEEIKTRQQEQDESVIIHVRQEAQRHKPLTSSSSSSSSAHRCRWRPVEETQLRSNESPNQI
uniref:Protein kinase domain-containing protein n=1 Tax=Xiphophorus couchianus TaxID=32473 RepID=A0A3B5MEL8_9TELE